MVFWLGLWSCKPTHPTDRQEIYGSGILPCDQASDCGAEIYHDSLKCSLRWSLPRGSRLVLQALNGLLLPVSHCNTIVIINPVWRCNVHQLLSSKYQTPSRYKGRHQRSLSVQSSARSALQTSAYSWTRFTWRITQNSDLRSTTIPSNHARSIEDAERCKCKTRMATYPKLSSWLCRQSIVKPGVCIVHI